MLFIETEICLTIVGDTILWISLLLFKLVRIQTINKDPTYRYQVNEQIISFAYPKYANP